MVNKDIYLKYYNDSSWELYNKGSLELCSNSHKDYLDLFRTAYDKPYPSGNILIVGGGDLQIFFELSSRAYPTISITVIDPCYGDYGRLCSAYNEYYKLIEVQSKINRGAIKEKFYKTVFSESFKEIKNKRFDSIIIDCSEEINPDTTEIYNSEKFVKQLRSILTPGGKIIFYVPPGATDVVEIMKKYFYLESVHTKYIEDWEETSKFFVFSF